MCVFKHTWNDIKCKFKEKNLQFCHISCASLISTLSPFEALFEVFTEFSPTRIVSWRIKSSSKIVQIEIGKDRILLLSALLELRHVNQDTDKSIELDEIGKLS